MKNTNIRMTDDVHAAMKALASEHHRSFQAECTVAFETYIAAARKDTGK